jgi:hypothetical protein
MMRNPAFPRFHPLIRSFWRSSAALHETRNRSGERLCIPPKVADFCGKERVSGLKPPDPGLLAFFALCRTHRAPPHYNRDARRGSLKWTANDDAPGRFGSGS